MPINSYVILVTLAFARRDGRWHVKQAYYNYVYLSIYLPCFKKKNIKRKKIKMATTTTRGITLRDISAADFIKAYAKFLKRSGRVDVPKWADIVKTGTHKQLAPLDPDWFFVRMAAVARRVYTRGGNGIGRLTKVYGGAKKRGSRPRRFVTGSGSVIRACVKQLEKLQVLEKDPKGGRRITSTGTRDLDRIAGQWLKKKQ
jgi:small subunit ribosomal protein S19e